VPDRKASTWAFVTGGLVVVVAGAVLVALVTG
jgi:hypothetical protein